MSDYEKLAKKLDALSHPLRLKIAALLTGGEMYLSEIGSQIGASRALAKIHLRKMEKAGLVVSRVVLVKHEARALRFYKLQDFDIHLTPKTIAETRGD